MANHPAHDAAAKLDASIADITRGLEHVLLGGTKSWPDPAYPDDESKDHTRHLLEVLVVRVPTHQTTDKRRPTGRE